ncbi:MAG: hypothetical protein GKC03_08145 [Methanomassiliicoccales archaeon]|nr:hypothetical protein [Methanomassiliicoccales archaeon]NYT16222.1 hypothetical protein [Methanomassiliicoccales archaeon]
MRSSQQGLTTLALVVVVAVVIVVVSAMVLILVIPLKPVDVHEYREVPSQSGAENIDLNLVGNIGAIEVTFDDLEDKFLTLDVWVNGAINIFDDPGDYNLSFEYVFSGDTLDVDVNLEPTDLFKGIKFLVIKAEVVISDELNADLDVMTNTGSVNLTTNPHINITRMQLNTNTGSVEAYLDTGTTLWNDIEMSTNTGSVYLQWEDLVLTQDITVTLVTSTGSTDFRGRQTVALGYDLEVSSTTQTGSVSADIDISGDISAEIDWSLGTGDTEIHREIGFLKDGNHMESNNFPAEDNISISLHTSTGNVDIWAEWND